MSSRAETENLSYGACRFERQHTKGGKNGNPALNAAPVANPPDRSARLVIVLLIGGLLVLFVYWNFGVYTVQPIGNLPDGVTVIVWRAAGEPFFSSPDGRCLQAMGEVSLLCRGVALGAAPVKRIVVRLPYQHWAYLASTGGVTFEK